MSTITALIVDDSKSVRFSLHKMLKQCNVEADTVESGAEAIDFLKNADKAPGVIFMDHIMPDMDGFETTRAIIADDDITDIPIIMCTSNEGADYVAEAKGIGAHGTIAKPPTPERLKEVIDNLECEAEAITATVEAEATITSEQIKQMLEAALSQKLEESIETITNNVISQVEVRARDLVSETVFQETARIQDETLVACNTQLQDLREEALKTIKEQVNDVIKAELEGHVGEVIQSGLDDVKNKARETEISWLADQDEFRTVVDDSAKKAAEATMASSRDEARRIATEVAEDVVKTSSGASSAEDAAKQARKMAVIAGIIGVLAAAVVYFIK